MTFRGARRLSLPLLAGALPLLAAQALAQPSEALRLDWSAPAECPNAASVLGRARDLVSPGATPDAKVQAQAVVEKGAVYKLILRMGSGGARTLESARCEDLAEATALLMALAVDPTAAARVGGAVGDGGASTSASASAGAGAGTGGVDATVVDATVTPFVAPIDAAGIPGRAARGEETASTTPWRVDVGIAGALESAVAPRPTFGGLAHVGIKRGWFRAQGYGAMFAAADAPGLALGAFGRFQLLTAGVRPCLVAFDDWVELSGCAGLEAQWLEARGSGVAQSREETARWVAGWFGVDARKSLVSGLDLTASGGATVPFARPTFELDGTPVHRPSALSARVTLGAAWTF